MRIYISEQITGLPINEATEKFLTAEKELKRQGFTPVNPMKVSPYEANKTWKQYMMDDIDVLFDCHAIYMLNNWQKSKGARIEFQIAKELGLEFHFE